MGQVEDLDAVAFVPLSRGCGGMRKGRGAIAPVGNS